MNTMEKSKTPTSKKIQRALIAIGAIQKEPHPTREGYDRIRANPWNPVAYLFVAAWAVLFPIIATYHMAKEEGVQNPFKWTDC